jgi:hypothetical protein
LPSAFTKTQICLTYPNFFDDANFLAPETTERLNIIALQHLGTSLLEHRITESADVLN